MLQLRSCPSRGFRPGPHRRLGRRCFRHTTRMLGGARRPPPPNYLAIACGLLNQLVRWHERMARREPHLFDFAAIDRQAAWEAELRCALDRVYGVAPPKTELPAK